MPFDHAAIERRWHPADDGIEDLLDPFVFKGSSAENGIDLIADDPFADDSVDLIFWDRIGAFEDLHHEFFVRSSIVASSSRSSIRIFLHCSRRSAGIGFNVVFRTHRFVVEEVGLHRNEVDHSFEFRLGADRAVDRNRVRMELFAHRLDGIEEIGSDSVHFVDECDTGNAIAVGLAPNGFRLGLNAGNRIEDCDGAVENAKRALHFDREVDVAWSVNDIDLAILSNRRSWPQR